MEDSTACPVSRRESRRRVALVKHFYALTLAGRVYDSFLRPCKFTGVKRRPWNINTMQMLGRSLFLYVFIGGGLSVLFFTLPFYLRVDFARRILRNTSILCYIQFCSSPSTCTPISSLSLCVFPCSTWLFPFVEAPSVKYLSYFSASGSGGWENA